MRSKQKFRATILVTLAFSLLFYGISVSAKEPMPTHDTQPPEGVLMSSMEVTVGEDSQVTVNEVEIPALEEESTLSHDQLVAMSALQGVTGQLDGVNGSAIRGWAWDSSRPNTALEVHIYIKNSAGTTVNAISGVMANQYRADLKNAGYGNGNHGFNYAYNFNAHPLGKYTVTVYAISGTGNNPAIGTRTFTHEARGMFENITSAGKIAGWAWLSSRPNDPIDVHIYIKNKNGETINAIGGVHANQFRQDLKDAGYGNGNHGFGYSYNWSAHPAGPYTVEVYAISGKGTNPALGLSPKVYANGSFTTGKLESVTSSKITGWAWTSSKPNVALTVHIRIWKEDESFDTKVTEANIQRSGIAGYGNGKHGFSYDIDWSAYPNGTYNVVAYALDGVSPTPPQIEGQISYVKGTSGAYVWPTVSTTVTSWFGWRVNGGVNEYHRGIDIKPLVSGNNDPVYLFADGKIAENYRSGSYGFMICANHVDPLRVAGYNYVQTKYAHLVSLSALAKNSSYSKGQFVQNMGTTGQSSGVHLHFETLHVTSLDAGYAPDNMAFDPMTYFSSPGVPVAASASAGGTASEPQYDEDGRLIVNITYDPDGAHCYQGDPEE